MSPSAGQPPGERAEHYVQDQGAHQAGDERPQRIGQAKPQDGDEEGRPLAFGVDERHAQE